MEYFVDEMPRDCASCKHYHMNCADGYSCSKLRKEIHPNFSEGIGYRHPDCPLQSLTDYTKQVRKEIVQEITQEVKKLIDSKDFKLCNHEYANGYCFGLQYDLAKILDQIQGEANGTWEI